MRVPLLDLTRIDGDERRELCAAFERVLDSGYFINGPEVSAFEAECADYIGAKHAIGMSSGTDALVAVLMGLDLQPGDEVICPTYTFFATAGSVWRVGAKPVFVDCDPTTYNWDEDAVLRAFTARTKAVMPVHLFGQCAEMQKTLPFAAARGVPVIEDAAQAIGATSRGRGAGTFGLAGCFSFFPSKNLGGLGDGGLVTTDDAAFAQRMREMRMHGMEPKYYHHFVGGNFRLDALQAACLRIKLRRLERAHTKRRENAARYDRLLLEAGVGVVTTDPASLEPGKIGLPVRVDAGHIYNQYTIRIPSGDGGRTSETRDAIRRTLTERGIGCEVYYPVPLHLQKCFAPLGHRVGDFPMSERAANETLALPVFPELTQAEQDYVVAVLLEAL